MPDRGNARRPLRIPALFDNRPSDKECNINRHPGTEPPIMQTKVLQNTIRAVVRAIVGSHPR